MHRSSFVDLVPLNSINPILRDTVLGTFTADGEPKTPTPLPKPDFQSGKMKTPWTEALQEHGYLPDALSDGNDMEDAEIASWFERPRVLIKEERTVVTEVYS